ncbi:hypothetical protein E4U33_005307, partial [Claviceps sp. LM78 group G4]
LPMRSCTITTRAFLLRHNGSTSVFVKPAGPISIATRCEKCRRYHQVIAWRSYSTTHGVRQSVKTMMMIPSLLLMSPLTQAISISRTHMMKLLVHLILH